VRFRLSESAWARQAGPHQERGKRRCRNSRHRSPYPACSS